MSTDTPRRIDDTATMRGEASTTFFGRSIGAAIDLAIAPGDAEAIYVATGVSCDADRELWVVDTSFGRPRRKAPISTST